MAAAMLNQAMKRKLESGTALNVREVGLETAQEGVFELKEFIEEIDYCDAERETWIWSIGRERSSGRILAATDGRFYHSPAFECLWLR